MDTQAKDWTGHGLEDLGSLAVGGLLYQTVNVFAKKALNMISPTIVSSLSTVPVVGTVVAPALLPLVIGALAVKFGKKIPGAAFVGEGLIAASVVGIGANAAQAFMPASLLSGVFYTPGMNGLGAVKYYPGMSGIPQMGHRFVPQLGAVKYYPGMSGIPQMGAYAPQLGSDPDFGKDVDYGGDGGYTEGSKYHAANFGAAADGTDDSGSGAAVGEDDSEVIDNLGSMG